MGCCSRASGVNPRVIQECKEKLKQLDGMYQSNHVMAAVVRTSADAHGSEGEIVVQNNFEDLENTEVIQVIAGFRRSASQFGQTLGQMDCRTLHVKGYTTIFSCFEAPPYVRWRPLFSSTLMLKAVSECWSGVLTALAIVYVRLYEL